MTVSLVEVDAVQGQAALVGRSAHVRPPVVAELDRHADERAVLGPRAVVVLDVRLAEQLVQHEPGVRRALADAAVGDGVLAEVDALVARRARAARRRTERAVVVGRLAPRDVRSRSGCGPAAAPAPAAGGPGASSLPANSSGQRTSTRFFGADRRDDLVAERADRRGPAPWRCTCVAGARRRPRRPARGASSSHFLRPPSSSLTLSWP